MNLRIGWLDMFPGFAVDNCTNVTERSPNIFSYTREAFARSGPLSNVNNLGIGQGGARAVFTEGVRRFTSFDTPRIRTFRKLTLLSVLLDHIGRVVFVSTNKQVTWVDTAGVIARMTNDKIIGNKAIVQFITQTMSNIQATMQFYLAVIGGISAPEPTFFRSARDYIAIKSALRSARRMAMSGRNKTDRFSDGPSPIGSSTFRHRNFFAASALARAVTKLQAVLIDPRCINLVWIKGDDRVVHGSCTSNTVAQARITREVMPGASLRPSSSLYLKNLFFSSVGERGCLVCV